jgi:hypothetical protein
MKLSAVANTKDFEKTLSGWEKDQLPFATAKALTQTGQKVKAALTATIQKSFDRPTKYTMGSVFMKPATKHNLVCQIDLKNWASKGAPPSVYLAPQVYGGARQPKASERLLRNKGVLPGGMFWVPGSGARLDSYGNMSRGQIVQVISALQANSSSGYTANKSYRIGARHNLNTDGYFVGKPANGLLPLGVYLRTKTGLKPIMIFVNSPHYNKLLPFFETVHEVYDANFQTIFNQALRDALILTPFLRAA